MSWNWLAVFALLFHVSLYAEDTERSRVVSTPSPEAAPSQEVKSTAVRSKPNPSPVGAAEAFLNVFRKAKPQAPTAEELRALVKEPSMAWGRLIFSEIRELNEKALEEKREALAAVVRDYWRLFEVFRSVSRTDFQKREEEFGSVEKPLATDRSYFVEHRRALAADPSDRRATIPAFQTASNHYVHAYFFDHQPTDQDVLNKTNALELVIYCNYGSEPIDCRLGAYRPIPEPLP